MQFVKFDSAEKDDGMRVELNVTASQEDVDSTLEEFYNALGAAKRISFATIDELVDKLNDVVGSIELKAAAKNYLLNKFTIAAARQSGVDYAIIPGVHAEDDPEPHKDYSFSINLTVRPVLSLSSLEPVTVELRKTTVEEEDIDNQLRYTAEQFATYRSIKRDVLKPGDFAVMDVDMAVEHKKLNKLSGKAKLVHVEKKQVPDGFIENVVGLRVGEMRKISFSVPGIMGTKPDEYEATVVLRDVREKIVPVINDAFIEENLPQFENLAGFKAYIRNDLESLKGRVDNQNIAFAVREALEKRLEGIIPDEMYEEAKESLMSSVVKKIESQDKTIDEYCEEHNIAKDAFNMNVFIQSSALLRQNLALDLLAKGRGLWETQEEIASAKAELPASLSSLSDEDFERYGYKKSLSEKIRRENAMKWLLSTAIIRK